MKVLHNCIHVLALLSYNPISLTFLEELEYNLVSGVSDSRVRKRYGNRTAIDLYTQELTGLPLVCSELLQGANIREGAFYVISR